MPNMTQTKLKCTKCGSVYPMWRNSGWRRKEDHIKHLYCFKCQETTAHSEQTEYSEWEAANDVVKD